MSAPARMQGRPISYVDNILQSQKELPPIKLGKLHKEINWTSTTIVLLPPIIGVVGVCYTPLQLKTAIFAVAYYFFTGLGITAGYHRLWSHRCYNASQPLQLILALAGAGAGQGSIKWWSRGHRSHHRYTDTDLDPYDARKGFLWSHIGWMLLKPRRRPGPADVSDLKNNAIVRWQHENYLSLLILMAFVVPTLIAKFGWNDAQGGYVYAAVVRLVFVHHSTFCVNSLAHWLGERSYDDKHTPRDHLITALVTVGEGYHNFHHQYPMDYRNAIKWYQYDPTKWTIWCLKQVGLASHLKTFPANEIRKGQLTMALKKMRDEQESLKWPQEAQDLPVVSWEEFKEQSAKHPLMVIGGFIHDVGSFAEEHPGGEAMIQRYIGKDATTAFFGGVYEHSNAAHNLLAMKRIGILHGGYRLANPAALPGAQPSSPEQQQDMVPEEERLIPPSQRLRVAQYFELKNVKGPTKPSSSVYAGGGWGSSDTAVSDDENEVVGKKAF